MLSRRKIEIERTSKSEARGAEEIAVGVESHMGAMGAVRAPDYVDRRIIVDDGGDCSGF